MESPDPDGDGQPNGSATGDDISLAYPGIPFPPGDEDGVVITGSLFPGFNKGATVTASIDGWLDAWVDFNADSTWSAAEKVYSGPVAAGANAIVFAVPAAASPGATFSRWRYNVAGVVLPPGGAGPDGEVEDYLLTICQPDLPAFTNLMFTNIVVTNITGGQVVTLQWNVESNAVYQVQCTSTFSNSPPVNWINFGPLISAPANTLVFTNTHVLERYYRICVPDTCP